VFGKTTVLLNTALGVPTREKAEVSGSEYWFVKIKFALVSDTSISELYGDTLEARKTLKIGYARVSTKDQTLRDCPL
jgi:hypothetical protein